MPTLVHLADERNLSRIKKNGLRIGKKMPGIYCMPVLKDFFVSHQWLRELKRSGGNSFVGVYFKINSSEKVYAGRYNHDHKHIELGEAIKEIESLSDPLGYEIIINRKITAKEIQKIKHLPQTIGWRYKPDSHGQFPCACDYCQRGKINANRVRNRLGDSSEDKPLTYKQILNLLKNENDEEEIENMLFELQGKKLKSDPFELSFLFDLNSDIVNRELALTLQCFRHSNTKKVLQMLLDSYDSETRQNAVESCVKIYGHDSVKIFVDTKDQLIFKKLIESRG